MYKIVKKNLSRVTACRDRDHVPCAVTVTVIRVHGRVRGRVRDRDRVP